jgi:uncharacterized membrane protein YhaH (DUF805 family)
MQVYSLLLKFQGRINRAKFWIGNGILLVLVFGMLLFGSAIDFMIFYVKGPSLFAGVWILATFALLIWAFFVLCIKRFHDHDSSGWWCLIFLVPAVGALFFIIELGMVRGTRGGNKYGPDPLE